MKNWITPERPDGIIKSMPIEFIEKMGGEKKFDDKFRRYLNRGTGWWYFSLSGKPRCEILYFYLLFGGYVRYRANILDYLPAGEMMTIDGLMHSRCWVRVSAPVIKFKKPYPRKGFQGFRYTCRELLEREE